MAPSCIAVDQAGDKAQPVVGNTNTGNFAQPHVDGDETKRSVGAPRTNDRDKDGHGQENPKPRSLNEHFQFSPEDSVPKKKKKNNNFMKRGPTALTKNRGTGFEDFYCDPPLTPEEATAEQNDLYSPDRPFVDRIEECIQRYRARRRMDSTRTNLFDKYLALGGIDTSPRMFQGMGSMDVDDAGTNEIRHMTAGDVIHRGSASSRYYNPSDAEMWDVDFSGVVAGFFSERIFKLAGTDMCLIKTAADVVENFLNYILHHDVCPEYAEDVRKAKAICRDALDQITRCFRATWESPGDLSIACSTLFDHGKRKVFDPDSSSVRYNMPLAQAQRVFFASLAVHHFLFQQLGGKDIGSIEVVDEVKQTFEVTEIRPPDEQQTQAYLGVKDMKGETGGIQPCGRLTLKPVDIEDGHDKGSSTGPAPNIGDEEEFVLDWSVLEHLTVSMKLKLVICILDNGFKFIKAFTDIRPRYYTFLPQELMLNYKEPVANEREAPSVTNPNAGVEDAADA